MKLKIRDLREEQDFSKRTISAFLLCDQSLYSKYVRGQRELLLRLAVQPANCYGVSLDYLVGLTEEQRPYSGKARRP